MLQADSNAVDRKKQISVYRAKGIFRKGLPKMMRRFKTRFATLAVVTLCTMGVARQASAIDLLDRMLGNSKVVADCSCAQKGGGHVQRCGSKCVSSHVQHSSHVQRAGKSKGGHVQRTAEVKGGKGGKKGCALVDLKAMMQSKFADATNAMSYAGVALKTRLQGHVDSMRDGLASLCPKFSFTSGKGKGKSGAFDREDDSKSDGNSDTAGGSAPTISIPDPLDPAPTT